MDSSTFPPNYMTQGISLWRDGKHWTWDFGELVSHSLSWASQHRHYGYSTARKSGVAHKDEIQQIRKVLAARKKKLFDRVLRIGLISIYAFCGFLRLSGSIFFR